MTDIINPDGTDNTAGFGVSGNQTGVIVYTSSKTTYVRRTGNGGASWTDRTAISPAGRKIWGIAFSSLGKHVDVVQSASGPGRDLYRHSGDGGVHWDPTVSLTPIGGVLINIARGPGGLVAMIGLDGSGNFAWRVRVSTNGGHSWGASRVVGHWHGCGDTAAGPDIAIAGNAIVVAFTNQDGKFVTRRSTNAGQSWSSPKVLGKGANYWAASLAVHGSDVVAVFDRTEHPSLDQRLVARLSTDRGKTWSSTILFGVGAAGAEVSYSRGAWRLVSTDDVGTWRYRSSADGHTWSAPLTIDMGHGFPSTPIGVGAFSFGGPAAAFLDGDIFFTAD